MQDTKRHWLAKFTRRERYNEYKANSLKAGDHFHMALNITTNAAIIAFTSFRKLPIIEYTRRFQVGYNLFVIQ